MERGVTFIGFGEAARAFAPACLLRAPGVRAFDIKAKGEQAPTRWAGYRGLDIRGCASAAEALAGAYCIVSLVTADAALHAATSAASHLGKGAFWFDMNSVAPDTKRQAAAIIDAAGGRYVDVAVMAPVHPQQSTVPLLVSGPHAGDGAAMLGALGFTRVRVIEGDVGRASSIKMIRSVIVKGMEALTAECVLAATRADVLDEVLASLDASVPAPGWAARADYNLDRMMIHGLRRAAEMEEVVKTLDALGTGSAMTVGTVVRQRAMGSLGLSAPPAMLAAKIEAALCRRKEEAA